MQGTSVRRAKPYCRSRVSPGRSATNASRVPVMALNRVDLPTLGRPINATTGSMFGLRLGGASAALAPPSAAEARAGPQAAARPARGGLAAVLAAAFASLGCLGGGLRFCLAAWRRLRCLLGCLGRLRRRRGNRCFAAAGLARYAAKLPPSSITTTVSSTATGGLLDALLRDALARHRSPVFLSSQCT